MKEPEMLQTIVVNHCLSYEIAFQVIQKNEKLTPPISTMAAKCGKMFFFYLKNYYQKVDKCQSKIIQQNV